MSENVGASTSHNPKGLHGLYRDNFTFYFFEKRGHLILGYLRIKMENTIIRSYNYSF
jgi:hypothetical protein